MNRLWRTLLWIELGFQFGHVSLQQLIEARYRHVLRANSA